MVVFFQVWPQRRYALAVNRGSWSGLARWLSGQTMAAPRYKIISAMGNRVTVVTQFFNFNPKIAEGYKFSWFYRAISRVFHMNFAVGIGKNFEDTSRGHR